MRATWYSRTAITAVHALNSLDILIPARIATIRQQIDAGTLDRARGKRQIAQEKGWATRFRRWLGGYRG